MFSLRKYADLLYKVAATMWQDGLTGEPPSESESSSDEEDLQFNDKLNESGGIVFDDLNQSQLDKLDLKKIKHEKKIEKAKLKEMREKIIDEFGSECYVCESDCS